MTHTYSRGCFKLIFRKCLPHTPLLSAVLRAHADTHVCTRTFFIAIARLLALSHRRAILQHLYAILFAVFLGLGYFFPFISLPFLPFFHFLRFLSLSYLLFFLHHLLRLHSFLFTLCFLLCFFFLNFTSSFIFVFMYFSFSLLHFFLFIFHRLFLFHSLFFCLLVFPLLLFNIVFFISSPPFFPHLFLIILIIFKVH